MLTRSSAVVVIDKNKQLKAPSAEWSQRAAMTSAVLRCYFLLILRCCGQILQRVWLYGQLVYRRCHTTVETACVSDRRASEPNENITVKNIFWRVRGRHKARKPWLPDQVADA